MKYILSALFFLVMTATAVAAAENSAPLEPGDTIPSIQSDGVDFQQWVSENCPDYENGYLLYVWWPGCGSCRRHLEEGFGGIAYPVLTVCFYQRDDTIAVGTKEHALENIEKFDIKSPVFFTQDETFHFRFAPCTLFVKGDKVVLEGIMGDKLPYQPLPDVTANVFVTADLPEEIPSVDAPWGDTGDTVKACADPVRTTIHVTCSATPGFDIPVRVKIRPVSAEAGGQSDLMIANVTMRDGETADFEIDIPAHTLTLYVKCEYTVGDAVMMKHVHIKSFCTMMGNVLSENS